MNAFSRPRRILAAAILLSVGAAGAARAEEPDKGTLHLGWSTRSITPDKPVALAGQFHKRISTHVEAPIMATALALETRAGDRVIDQAIMISCDLVAIRERIQSLLRERLEGKLPGFDLRKLFLSATHTHTAPVTRSGKSSWYEVNDKGVMKPDEYVEFLVGRLTEAAVEAWKSRRPGGVNWGLGYAVVGLNRRMVYADGRSVMYGRNTTPDFRSVEGYEDHGVETLFFWNEEKKLTGVAVNVACPSQVVEGRRYLSSDFWHDVREVLRERYAKDLHILAWTGAAGDQSPHHQYRRRADTRMRKLHGGVSETRAIAIRIADAVDYAYHAVRKEILTEVAFAHHVEDLVLPARRVTEKEYRSAKAVFDRHAAIPEEKRKSRDLSRMRWHKRVMDRYERAKEVTTYAMELHALRLGDIAIATNPFELYIDYGIQMKTRSKALQTFIVQLACASGAYLPTEKAVRGGGYSAIVESSLVGPKGGRVLVDRTVTVLNGMWKQN